MRNGKKNYIREEKNYKREEIKTKGQKIEVKKKWQAKKNENVLGRLLSFLVSHNSFSSLLQFFLPLSFLFSS